MTDHPLLRVRDLSVTFRVGRTDVEAVRHVSLEVRRGETVAVVGESGSGKSTTAAAINRLLPTNGRIAGGEVWFDGRDLIGLPESQLQPVRGARIGLVPQDPMSNLNPLMRIGAQIAEALEVHAVASGREAHQRAVELLAQVGIANPAHRAAQYPHEFSGGMRQRALIAIGLACRPDLLIADEPTSALDVTVQRRILDQLDHLTDELGTAVVLITHDLGLAAERADRVMVMYRGEIVESGPAAALLASPQHEYTRRLLDAAPGLAAKSLAVPRPATEADRPLLAVAGLRKEYSLRGSGETIMAVDDVSLSVGRGETVSIVGESGSGKSTTANLILALEPPTAGTIAFDGMEIAGGGGSAVTRRDLFAFRRRVQPVFQNPFASLDPRHCVGRSIAEPLAVHGIGNRSSRARRVAELLDQVALPATTATRYPHELSGGQRQRVAIARALALEPELIVLDEPVSALDVVVQMQILELLASLQRELGLSYLFISHDLAVVRMISHMVHVMQAGKLVESGTPDTLFEHPQADYTAELLAAIPGASSPA